MQTNPQYSEFNKLVNCILNIEHEIILTNTTKTTFHNVLVYCIDEISLIEFEPYAKYSSYNLTDNTKNSVFLVLTKTQIKKLLESKKIRISLGYYENMFIDLVM